MNKKTQTFKDYWRAFALPLVSCSAKCNAQCSSILCGSATATFLVVFALSIVVSGCGKINGPGRIRGNGIAISATTLRQSNSATKTVYGGRDKISDKKEPIYWSSKDLLVLTCAEADATYGTSAEYEVMPTSNPTKALIAAKDNGNGLWWGTADRHKIYGLYPSQSQNSAASLTTAGVASVTMPKTQTLSKDKKAPVDSLLPNMNYAYLWGGVSTPKTNSVGLVFQPGFTAFEFTVKGASAEDITLNSFTLSSENCAVSGNYTIAITVADAPNSGNSTAVYSVPPYSKGTNDKVEVAFPTGSDAIKVNSTKSLTFTVFALPSAASNGPLTQIKIGFNMSIANGQTLNRSLFLKYSSTHSDPAKQEQFIKFPATCKAFINFSLPDFKDITLDIEDVKINPLTDTPETINFRIDQIDVTLINEDEDDGPVLINN